MHFSIWPYNAEEANVAIRVDECPIRLNCNRSNCPSTWFTSAMIVVELGVQATFVKDMI